jgi:hypothetical protein
MYAAPWVRAVLDPQEGTVTLFHLLLGRWYKGNAETGCTWEFLQAGDDVETALKRVAAVYGVPAQFVRQDQADELRMLRRRGMLTKHCYGRPKTEVPSRPWLGELGQELAPEIPPVVRRAARTGQNVALMIEWLPFPLLLGLLRLGRRLCPEVAPDAVAEAIVVAVRETHTRWPLRRACFEKQIASFFAGLWLGKAPYWCLGSRFGPRANHSWSESSSLRPIGESEEFCFLVAVRI